MNLPIATIKAINDWRYKILSNVLIISLILFIISLFKKSWAEARFPLLGVFIVSGILIYFLFKKLGN